MSAKRTVTCFRSPSNLWREARIFSARCLGTYVWGGATPPSAGLGALVAVWLTAWPQFRQKLAPWRLGSPQWGQAFSSRAPQWSQKAALEGLSDWQRGQIMKWPQFHDDIFERPLKASRESTKQQQESRLKKLRLDPSFRNRGMKMKSLAVW